MYSKLTSNRIKNLYRDKQFSVGQTAKKLGVPFWSLYYFMNKNSISRRSPFEVNYLINRNKPQFKINNDLNEKYRGLKIAGIMLYWRVTGMPINQFTKPYVREGSPNLSERKLPYGLVHLRYNDKRLLETISTWIEDYRKVILIRVGTQVAKGGRLCNRSVMPKGVMEK